VIVAALQRKNSINNRKALIDAPSRNYDSCRLQWKALVFSKIISFRFIAIEQHERSMNHWYWLAVELRSEIYVHLMHINASRSPCESPCSRMALERVLDSRCAFSTCHTRQWRWFTQRGFSTKAYLRQSRRPCYPIIALVVRISNLPRRERRVSSVLSIFPELRRLFGSPTVNYVYFN